MNDHTNGRFINASKAALLGCGLCTALTLGMLENYFSLGNSILIALPSVFIIQILGLSPQSASALASDGLFALLINAILGTLLFGGVALLWGSLVKGNKETTEQLPSDILR